MCADIVYFPPKLVEVVNKEFREIYKRGVNLTLHIKETGRGLGRLEIDSNRNIKLKLKDYLIMNDIPYTMKREYSEGKREYSDYDFWLYFQGNFGTDERMGLHEDLLECGLEEFDEIDLLLINLGKGPNRYYFEYVDKDLEKEVHEFLEEKSNLYYKKLRDIKRGKYKYGC